MTFAIPEGGIMGLIGANGAGKSTTIRILLGLVHADHGDVQVLGHPIPAHQVEAKQHIGFVSEDMRLYGAATLAWHMDFLSRIYPTWDQSYALHMARRFDLKLEQKLKGFSHGQRVKATLLLALAHCPKLLVLDEPTTGLDPVARYEVLEELMEVLVDEERTILFSSHNTLDVEQMSDQIMFIDRGQVVSISDKETYLDQWRRLRLHAPEVCDFSSLPVIGKVKQNGTLAVVTTDAFEPSLPSLFEQAGLSVQAVERMTLEEIFVANVMKSRDQAL
ncbi:MAG: ABC transporter ATP-binding protein [Rhodothermales bacterium]